jgi:hypothetical protein
MFPRRKRSEERPADAAERSAARRARRAAEAADRERAAAAGGDRQPRGATARARLKSVRAAARPRRRPDSDGGGDAGAAASPGQNPFVAGLAEVAAIGREMLRIPAEFALEVAERLGLVVLAAWRRLVPLMQTGLVLVRRGLAVAEREVTPLRAVAVVGLLACGLLATTQFLDYRDVQAGVPAYEGVEDVAPAPVVSGTEETAGSAHLYVLLAVALAAGVLIVMSLRGRPGLGRYLLVLGLAAVAVAAFIDAPQGLDEGAVATQFEGARAHLLGPFWVQVFAGAVIAACGPLLALGRRPTLAGERARPRRTEPSSLRGPTPAHGARP